MKYIRTKDGRIIDLTHWIKRPMLCIDKENNLVEEDICYQTQWFEKIGNGDACYVRSESISHNNQVINQADTIEELCDEFVVFGEHIIPSHTHFLSLTDIGIKSCLEAKAIIYGAIWTDKGLIYVAKMNEKGELELI